MAYQYKDELEDIVLRYGSLENVFKHTPLEKEYDEALKPLADNEGGTWDGGHTDYSPSPKMEEAIASVRPFPDNIIDALIEDEMWDNLDNDRTIADTEYGLAGLSDGAAVRRSMVWTLLDRGLVCRNMDDLIQRIEYFDRNEQPINAKVLLRDLEHIKSSKEKRTT